MVQISGSISLSTSEITIKIVVSEDFINKVFRQGFECFVASSGGWWMFSTRS